MINKIIKFFFFILGFKVFKNNSNCEILNISDYNFFIKGSKFYKLYYKGLLRSQNEKSDNIPKKIRFNLLTQLVQSILKRKNIYNFAECGCWRGHSSFMISKLIADSKKKIEFHIFDSFEGLSEVSKNDSELDSFNLKEKSKIRIQFNSNEDFVKNKVLKDFTFCKVYKGWIPKRFNEVKNKKFSFVHIDVDLYKPTLESLSFFFPRLVTGGIIICDDYNSRMFNGAQKAWDHYFKHRKFSYFFHNPIGGCFLIK
jgi:O-methyltransferase